MTGITFMNDITIPRRSSLHPSRFRRRSSGADEETNVRSPSVADYFIAMALHIPTLELYAKVAKSLQSWVELSQEQMERTNEEAKKVPPKFFQEYVEADPEDQTELVVNILLLVLI
jgi:kinetochore protein Spc7/SPC105